MPDAADKATETVCTREHPDRQAAIHPDAGIVPRGDSDWPKWTCPHCGLHMELPVDTATGRRTMGQQ